ncbi:hypothetical protein [Streptomyces kanamyceticus]|uniref:Secreted protein n=1 Tax=Streptomyces kanamyceticus TaxID=1967 RepID=A0A5J6GBS3_STRKN|nr:hypothetical protein [Streptomyces kanamyceticus]QEU93280.1 hypothetical protein CP970_22225 [Streptomyces kanamyceticus]
MRRAVRSVLGAGAAALCLGGLLSACGGDSGDGYVATGPAGASPERAPGKTVAPTGDVDLVPLDAGGGKRGSGSGAPSSAGAGDNARDAGGSGDAEGKSPSGKAGSDAAGSTGSTGPADPSGGAPSSSHSPGGRGGSGPTEGHSGTPSSPPGTDKPTPPSGPAKLDVGDPERKPADKRWCEKVTVTFRNTGGSPVRSGTVTFGTHIIGALGIDWATIESTVKLPAPIAPGRKKEKTWPVCVDAWRVPPGMHVETQDVSVDWK